MLGLASYLDLEGPLQRAMIQILHCASFDVHLLQLHVNEEVRGEVGGEVRRGT